MTNAEKYLKDGVDIEEFSESIMTWYFGDYAKANDFARIKKWAVHKIETLTEDERVILRNIEHRFDKIKRLESGLLVVEYQGLTRADINIFNDLFQFIKERRRI